MNLTAIAIVGIICWTIVSLVDSRKAKKQNKQQSKSADNSALHARMDQMQARIETLEKIVTDEKYDLNRQFEALSKESSNSSDRAA